MHPHPVSTAFRPVRGGSDGESPAVHPRKARTPLPMTGPDARLGCGSDRPGVGWRAPSGVALLGRVAQAQAAERERAATSLGCGRRPRAARRSAGLRGCGLGSRVRRAYTPLPQSSRSV